MSKMCHFGEYKSIKLGDKALSLILIDNEMFAVKDGPTGDLLALGAVRGREVFYGTAV